MRSHRLLRLRKPLLTAVALILILCTGCGQMLAPFALSDPTATGTWTGRLMSVTVRDHEGREYRAAALHVESGPRTLRGDTGTYTIPEGQDVALLCPVGVAIIDPAELGVPVGSRVKVSGRMLMASALKFEHGYSGAARGISLREPWEGDGELVIQMRGKPKVLTE